MNHMIDDEREKSEGDNAFLNLCIRSSPFTGDVLQLSFPLCGAVLFPGQRFNAEGVGGWHRSHVHSQSETASFFFNALSPS